MAEFQRNTSSVGYHVSEKTSLKELLNLKNEMYARVGGK